MCLLCVLSVQEIARLHNPDAMMEANLEDLMDDDQRAHVSVERGAHARHLLYTLNLYLLYMRDGESMDRGAEGHGAYQLSRGHVLVWSRAGSGAHVSAEGGAMGLWGCGAMELVPFDQQLERCRAGIKSTRLRQL